METLLLVPAISLLFSAWCCEGIADHATAHYTHNSYCPPPNSTQVASLHWSVPPAIVDFSCEKQYKELHCCATGYSRLQWYKQRGGSWVPLNTHHYHRVNSNQTVQITRVSYEGDRGSYKCVATRVRGSGDNQVIENKVYLDVIANCSDWHRRPLVSWPQGNMTQHKSLLGSNTSLVCQAFFGNCYEDECSVDWLRLREPSNFTVFTPDNHTRIHTQVQRFMQKTGQTVMKNTLHIQHVQEADFGHYKCSSVNAYGEEPRYVYLSKQTPPPDNTLPTTTTIAYIGGAAAALVCVLALAGITTGYFTKSVGGRLKWRQMFGAYPKESRQYDVVLIYHTKDGETTPDQTFAEDTLTSTLTEKYKYKVFNRSHIIHGQLERDSIGSAVQVSHCVLFVISPDFLCDGECLSMYRNVQHEECQHIYVQYARVTEQQEEAFCTQQRAENADNEPETLFKSIRAGQTLTWPEQTHGPEPRNTRTEANTQKQTSRFWKQLQLFLPKPRPAVPTEVSDGVPQEVGVQEVSSPRERVQSDNSDTPLLQA